MGIEAKRDSKWRPGGEHKDPRQKYKDAKKAKWTRFKQNIRARSGGKGEEVVVISHVVLFRPRATLTPEQRTALIESLKAAVTGIPSIKRTTIGKRILLNRPGYETQMAEHYEYSAILEFDSEADLRAYLDHPAHSESRAAVVHRGGRCPRLRFCVHQPGRLELMISAAGPFSIDR